MRYRTKESDLVDAICWCGKTDGAEKQTVPF